MPRNLSEVDRKKNHFNKEERFHLLAIMKRYAPQLDKSASTLARKKIWMSIEDEFKRAGFTRKTSAQLKKYWQNYKYHCKRSKTFGKENKRGALSEVDDNAEWNRYQVFVDDPFNATLPSEVSRQDRRSIVDDLQASPEVSDRPLDHATPRSSSCLRTTEDPKNFIDLSRVKMEYEEDEEIITDECKMRESGSPGNVELREDCVDEAKETFTRDDRPLQPLSASSSTTWSASSPFSSNVGECKTKNRIVVSSAEISNNSVTVSVLYPGNEDGRSFDKNEKTMETKSTSDGFSVQRSDLEEYRSFVKSGKPQTSREKGSSEMTTEENHNFETEETARQEGVRENTFCTRKERMGPRNYVILSDCRNRLKHRLLLQQLETEEKRLKIKIAEMAIQEVQLRIKALSDDMRRTEELHRLRLARAASGSMDL